MKSQMRELGRQGAPHMNCPAGQPPLPVGMAGGRVRRATSRYPEVKLTSSRSMSPWLTVLVEPSMTRRKLRLLTPLTMVPR